MFSRHRVELADYVAEMAFGAIVELQCLTADEARAELSARATNTDSKRETMLLVQLRDDALFIEHATTAARAWEHIGANPEAAEAASKAYSRAAFLFGTDAA